MAEARYHAGDPCHHEAVYKMSCEQFDALFEFAEGRCQICRDLGPETKRGFLVIDHLAPYGPHVVRGLLCDRCNKLMELVDTGKVRPTSAVYRYRYNAWFARQVHPKGPDVWFRLRTDPPRSRGYSDIRPEAAR